MSLASAAANTDSPTTNSSNNNKRQRAPSNATSSAKREKIAQPPAVPNPTTNGASVRFCCVPSASSLDHMPLQRKKSGNNYRHISIAYFIFYHQQKKVRLVRVCALCEAGLARDTVSFVGLIRTVCRTSPGSTQLLKLAN